MVLLAAEVWLDRQVALAADAAEFGVRLRASILVKSCVPVFWLAFVLFYAGGAPPGLRIHLKWLLPAALVLAPGLVMAFPDVLQGGRGNGVWFGRHVLPWIGKGWGIACLLTTLAVLIQFEKTFRGSVGMTRWRIKYLILGLALIFAVRAYASSQTLLFSGYHRDVADFLVISLLFGVLAIGVGLARGCFGQIEIYPSRAVLQGSVTLVLAGGYLIVIGILARWGSGMTGNSGFPTQALILLMGFVGLAMIMLSERIRSAFQSLISRHFHRPEHDFREIWTEFSRQTSSVHDAAALARKAAEVVPTHFHVLGVFIFQCRPETTALRWLHSTDNRMNGTDLPIDPAGVAFLTKNGRPMDLERSREPWSHSLREHCPGKFEHGGNRLLVPLVSAERLVGLMVLADRVNGTPYSDEEMDLLKCIGDQLAGALLNASLGEEVLQAKEMEAFQTVSSFFVHDLKNAAASLSLLLQNLPAHYEDPEFRADAMRGVGRTVERINQLIVKLGSLKSELRLCPRPCRLDALCAEVLDTTGPAISGPAHVELDLQPVPEQSLDPEAMRSVVTNLVTNAREALNGDGLVKVSTRCDGGKVEVVVADDGCGMSAEFVRSRLFHPFHTTKSHGVGIGMFQCRKIVEAHGGSISVETGPGRGTRFTILLPVNSHPPFAGITS